MRMTWTRRKVSALPRVDRMQFVMWDFVRMLLAAIVFGVAVSLVAAGIALVLAYDAYAVTPSADSATANSGGGGFVTSADAELQPYPGVLMISSGCDADMLEATERDWKVTINGKYTDVRVMQTFIVPAGDSTVATFSAALPTGARLLGLNAHTVGNLWRGKIFDEKSYGQLTAIDFRDLSRSGVLIVQEDDGAISTDAIINIAATEAVTIEYTYRLPKEETQISQNLLVTMANHNTLFGQVARDLPVSGTVWLQWLGKNPSRLTRIPSGAFLETSGSKITGLSWATRQVSADAPFQIAWSM